MSSERVPQLRQERGDRELLGQPDVHAGVGLQQPAHGERNHGRRSSRARSDPERAFVPEGELLELLCRLDEFAINRFGVLVQHLSVDGRLDPMGRPLDELDAHLFSPSGRYSATGQAGSGQDDSPRG